MQASSSPTWPSQCLTRSCMILFASKSKTGWPTVALRGTKTWRRRQGFRANTCSGSLKTNSLQYFKDGTPKESGATNEQILEQSSIHSENALPRSQRSNRVPVWVTNWMPSRKTWSELHRGHYDGARLDTIFIHAMKTHWHQWDANPYNLPPIYYLLIFATLAAWAIGSIVCGYIEANARLKAGDTRGAIPILCRGLIGAIPALTQITLFLFPPLYVPTCSRS